MDLKSIAHLGRFTDIVSILLKYGFKDAVERLDAPGKALLKKIQVVNLQLNTWQRIRHALEELGPTFIKYGQIMSLRPDWLPAPVILELEKLQEDVAQVRFDDNVVGEAEPYVKRLAHERMKSKVQWRRPRNSFSQTLMLQKQVPRRLNRMIEKIEQGQLSVRLEH